MLRQELIEKIETLIEKDVQNLFNKLTNEFEVALDEQYDPTELISREFLDLRETAMRLILKKLSTW